MKKTAGRKKAVKKVARQTARKGATKAATRAAAGSALQRVAARAMRDPEFWTQLRADPDAVLRTSRIALSAQEYESLRGILSLDGRTIEVDLDAYMLAAREGGSNPGGFGGGLSWLAMWSRDIVDPSVVR